MTDEYVDDTSVEQPKKRCVVCGKLLSIYNETDQCFHHNEILPGNRASVEEEPEAPTESELSEVDSMVQADVPREQVIIKLVCESLLVDWGDIISPTRKAGVVHARQIIMYLLYKDTSLSYPSIGEMLGNRDHTTVIHGVDAIAMANMVDDEVQSLIKRLRSQY